MQTKCSIKLTEMHTLCMTLAFSKGTQLPFPLSVLVTLGGAGSLSAWGPRLMVRILGETMK